MSKTKIRLANGDFVTHAEICAIFPTFDLPEKALVMRGYAREELPFDHKHRWSKKNISAFVRKLYPSDISEAFDEALGIETPRATVGRKSGGGFK